MGPAKVKNARKFSFHTNHLPPNPIFSENKIIKSHSLLNTKSELKDEFTDLHKTLQKFIFSAAS